MYTHKKQALDMIENVAIVLSNAIFSFQIMVRFLKSKSAWRSTIKLVIWSAQMNCARVPNHDLIAGSRAYFMEYAVTKSRGYICLTLTLEPREIF